jgi:signal transduction histidine kinase
VHRLREGARLQGYLAQRYVVGSPTAPNPIGDLIGPETAILYVNQNDFQGPWVRSTGEVEAAPADAHAMTDSHVHERGGSSHLASVSPVVGSPWAIVLEVPMAVANARANTFLQRTAIVALALALLGSLIAWLIGRQTSRLLAETRAAVSARDDMMAIVSHDLGNPVAAIRLGAAVLLKQLPPTDATNRVQVENIRTSALHMERMIRDLLDARRIESGHLILEKEKTSAGALLDEAIDGLRPVIEGKNIVLRESRPSDSAFLMVDRERAIQVFSNLVGNAVKFTPTGGEIVAGAKVENQAITFWVSDTGPGIPAEQLRQVFDRFWQGRPTDRRGIGLGLTIAKGIVDAHAGRIWVESTVGVGTTFYFQLPSA